MSNIAAITAFLLDKLRADSALAARVNGFYDRIQPGSCALPAVVIHEASEQSSGALVGAFSTMSLRVILYSVADIAQTHDLIATDVQRVLRQATGSIIGDNLFQWVIKSGSSGAEERLISSEFILTVFCEPYATT